MVLELAVVEVHRVGGVALALAVEDLVPPLGRGGGVGLVEDQGELLVVPRSEH